MNNDNENYKGKLQQFCAVRGLTAPQYESQQQGNSHEPSWIATVRWGDSEYTSDEPIQGSKKHIEQMAAKQVLISVDQARENFLAAGTVELEAPPVSELEPLEVADAKPMRVPAELLSTPLGIANHRHNELRRSRQLRQRYNSDQTDTNEAFTKEITALTMDILTELHRAAKQRNIKIDRTK